VIEAGTPEVASVQDRRNQSLIGAAVISLMLGLAILSAAFAARADAQILGASCDSPLTYCTIARKTAGNKYILELHAYKIKGRYTLCVRNVSTGNRECRRFRLHDVGVVYSSRVNFRKKFNPGHHGKYCATWRKPAHRIGHGVCFRYRG
jgi:hypothetical protein